MLVVYCVYSCITDVLFISKNSKEKAGGISIIIETLPDALSAHSIPGYIQSGETALEIVSKLGRNWIRQTGIQTPYSSSPSAIQRKVTKTTYKRNDYG